MTTLALSVGLTLVIDSGVAEAGTGIRYHVVDADRANDGGVFYRNSPSWNDSARSNGVGGYYGETVELVCGAWGDAVGPYQNRRWHLVDNISRPAAGRGWLPDRYLDTPNRSNEATPNEPECGAAAPPASTTAPTAPQSFSARRCAGDQSGRLVDSLSATPEKGGYKIAIKPGPKGKVPWYADNDKIAAATSDMWAVVKPCIAALPLALNADQSKTTYYQLNCHFWGQRGHAFGEPGFGGTYDLETWRSASIIPTNNFTLQFNFYRRSGCNW